MSLVGVGGMSSGVKGVSDYSGLLPILLPPPPLSCISLFFLQNFTTMITLTALLHMDRNTMITVINIVPTVYALHNKKGGDGIL